MRAIESLMELRRRTFITLVLGTIATAVAVAASSYFGIVSRARRTMESTTSGMIESTTGLPRAEVDITVDSSKVVGRLDGSLWANIGYDPIFSGTVAPEAKLAWDLLRENKPLRYVRCHNMFSDTTPAQPENRIYGCRVYGEDEAGNPVYNWKYLDQVLDTWLSVGLRPILEADFMPDKLAEGAIVRNYSGGAINTPRDYWKWRNLIYETVKHCKERYGAEEIRKWYWEIWNEPDLKTYFIDGLDPAAKEKFTPLKVARLNKMYDHFVDGVTAAEKDTKVGGPGIAGNEDYLTAFLDHCVKGRNEVTHEEGTRIDFISWHAYGNTNATLAKNRAIRKLIETQFPSLMDRELQQNEWGQQLRINGIPTRSDSVYTEYEAAFLCRYVDAILSDPSARVHKFLRWGQITATGMGWRTLTGRIGSDIYRTAVLNAYEMLAKLGDEMVELSGPNYSDPVHGIAARTGSGSVQALIYHFDENDPESTGTSRRVQVNFRGLAQSGEVRLTHYRIDKQHSNPYAFWIEAGKPSRLSHELSESMRTQSELQTVEGVEMLRSGQNLVASFELPVNACSLLVLEPA